MLKNVLVVDDVLMNRKIVKGILAKTVEGINILEAGDGAEALKMIEEHPVNAVVLDIMMPVMDGLEVLSKIKGNAATKNLPVIMCSAIHEIESVETALRLGALDYFTKPLTEEQMRVTLPLKIKNALEYYENKNELVRFYEHIKDEMQMAEQLQKSLVSEFVEFETGKMHGRYIPCEEVGGDIFCVKYANGKLWFMIADISGHGISAAMVSSMMNVIFNTTVEYCEGPDCLMKKINNILFEVFGGSKYGLISAFAGFIENNTICYANAGHPYPLLYKNKDRSFNFLEIQGFLLGMFENCDFKVVCSEIEKDDAVLLYTDGLFDKGVNEGFAGWDKVRDFCIHHSEDISANTDLFLNNMISNLAADENRKFIDDVAVMLVVKK